ncbi:RidA family protein [Rhodococcus sp. ABRD24]|uniref:RidA family protein n=1 Tax=Rhodococcus sp. ABRD24 TaxID=2507582 RepID=UPI00103E1266|nr:Rid family hydrolase [Rhodococcus sp. ABRD24]QBJ95879.1 RidA family protein [Rhodococcus sp. ABRD24]
MSKRQVSTTKAAAPGAFYSQAIVANGFLYTAGLGPQHPETGEIVGTTVADQTEQTIKNLEAVLAVEGLDLSDVVKATVHLADLAQDFRAFDKVYRHHFPAPLPARTTVGSELWGIRVEIDVVAALRPELDSPPQPRQESR